MLSLRQPDTFRRRIGGVALIGTMVTLLASELFGPRGAGDNSELLTAVAADRTGFVVSTLLLLVSTILLIPAVMAVLHLVRDRAPVIGHVAGAFGMLRALGHMAVVCLRPVRRRDGRRRFALGDGLAARPPRRRPRRRGAALDPELRARRPADGHRALPRARRAPRWVMLAAIAAGVVELGAPGGTLAAALVKQTLVVVAFGAVGTRVLRMTDQEWRSRAALAHPARHGAEPAVAS